MFSLKHSGYVYLTEILIFLLAYRLSSVECHVESPELGEGYLHFFALGDWGGLPISPYTTKVERAIAKEMGNLADSLKPEFILALGTVGML